MWLFTSNGFLSIVAHRNQPGMLLVRARRDGEIEEMFPDATVTRTDRADYLFRAVVPRQDVANTVAHYAKTIDYDNFKNSVSDRDRHDAYMNTWTVMNRYQRECDGPQNQSEDDDHWLSDELDYAR